MVTRIRELLDHKQLSPTQFADLIGVGRPVVSHILSERNKPSLEVVQRIIAAFPEISLPWLLSGVGSMLGEAATANAAPEPTSPATTIASVPAEIAPIAQPVVATPLTPAPAAPPTSPPDALPAPTKSVAGPAMASATEGPAVPLGPAAKSFRVPRFVPPTPARGLAAAATPASAAAIGATSVPTPSPPSEVQAIPQVAPVPAPASVPALPPPPHPADAAMLPLLAEPGKAIRRIVIFYRDGSFADYQPEA